MTQDRNLTFERRMKAIEERVKALEATPRVKEAMSCRRVGLARDASQARTLAEVRGLALADYDPQAGPPHRALTAIAGQA